MTFPSILLVDDSELSCQITMHYINKMGMTGISVDSGIKALEYCRHSRPDLILMDVSMPEMDGLETTSRLREQLGGDWIPIIFLTGCDTNEEAVQGLKAGGDDYLVKPVNQDLLSAKIQVFLRIASLQQQIARDAIRLAHYYEANEAEQTLALELIQRLTYRYFSGQQHIWHHLNPAETFNGDLICRSVSPDGIEYVLLADCTGHGLTAAISALPVIDGFYELVNQYLSLPLLASGINKKLHSLLPTGRFVASVAGAIDYTRHTLSIWNGGIPCVVLLDRQGRIKQTFSSDHPALGVLDETLFDHSISLQDWQAGDVLIMSSDGITEARNDQGEMFGIEGIVAATRQGWPDRIGPSILDTLKQHLQGKESNDDVSLLVIHLNERYRQGNG
jgi:DNA-binding response OmpR family regulator